MKCVFPAIRNLETVGGEKTGVTSWLRGEFEKLEAEHEKTGAALNQFKELTDSYTPPDWACNTMRALYDALAHLEKDMHQHVHEENNVLFPKARALAATGSSRGGGRSCLSQGIQGVRPAMKLEIPKCAATAGKKRICTALRQAGEKRVVRPAETAELLEAILLPHLAKERVDILQPLGLLPTARPGRSHF